MNAFTDFGVGLAATPARPRARVADIFTIAGRLSCYPVDVLTGTRRMKAIVRVRFAVWLIAREYGHSYPTIGRICGGKDHSTILRGVKQAELHAARDPEYAAFIDELRVQSATAAPFVPQFQPPPPGKPVYTPPAIKVPPPRVKAKNVFTYTHDDPGESGGIIARAKMRDGSRKLAEALNGARAT